MDNLRIRPANLSPSEAYRWDSWEQSGSARNEYLPSPAEIDHMARLARHDQEAFSQIEGTQAQRPKGLSRDLFIEFLLRHRGQQMTRHELAEKSGFCYPFVKRAISNLTAKDSPLVRRVENNLIEIR